MDFPGSGAGPITTSALSPELKKISPTLMEDAPKRTSSRVPAALHGKAMHAADSVTRRRRSLLTPVIVLLSYSIKGLSQLIDRTHHFIGRTDHAGIHFI